MIRPSGRAVAVAVATARTTAAIVSLAILLTSGWAWAAYRSFSTNVHVATFVPTRPHSTAPVGGGSDENILLIGDDSRAGATTAELADLGTTDNPGDNTDTIMLLHVPADGRSASLMSFPRDSLVTAPGSATEVKINALYEQGGAQLLGDTITELTGLVITHFIKVGLLGFDRISKAIGGIDINLCEAQNASTDVDDNGKGPYTGIDLRQGLNHDVEGKQALAFVRQRHGPRLDDYTRVARQRYFIAAAFTKSASRPSTRPPVRLPGRRSPSR